MSADEPIELPGLSAQRRGPSAAVCASGHLFSWFVEGPVEPAYCLQCGDPILFACPICKAALPPDGEMLRWVPYHGNCMYCGTAYPWKAAEIARAKRALAEQADVAQWEPAVRSRADELVDDIAANRASAFGVAAAVTWLARSGGATAETTILDTVERLASAELKQALRPLFPGHF
jgi:hypothetical protein